MDIKKAPEECQQDMTINSEESGQVVAGCKTEKILGIL